MARETPERKGGGIPNEILSRTKLSVTKAQLETYGAATNDLILIYPYLASSAKTLACAGATAIAAQQAVVAGASVTRPYYKKWDGASAIEVTWDATSLECVLVVEVIRKWDEATPIDVVSAWTTFSAKTSFTSPTITTATDHSRQFIFEVNGTGSEYKATAGFVIGVNYSPSIMSRERAVAEATGTTAVELTGSCSGCFIAFAVRGKEVAAAKSPPFASRTYRNFLLRR